MTDFSVKTVICPSFNLLHVEGSVPLWCEPLSNEISLIYCESIECKNGYKTECNIGMISMLHSCGLNLGADAPLSLFAKTLLFLPGFCFFYPIEKRISLYYEKQITVFQLVTFVRHSPAVFCGYSFLFFGCFSQKCGYSFSLESMMMVTGPSLTKATCISAPNTPRCVGFPSSCANSSQ